MKVTVAPACGDGVCREHDTCNKWLASSCALQNAHCGQALVHKAPRSSQWQGIALSRPRGTGPQEEGDRKRQRRKPHRSERRANEQATSERGDNKATLSSNEHSNNNEQRSTHKNTD